MTIKLSIEITTPLTPDDHEMLSGITVMTLAIANRTLAEERFPEAFVEENRVVQPPEAATETTEPEATEPPPEGRVN